MLSHWNWRFISYRTSVTLSWWFSNLFSFSARRKLFFRLFFLITASALNFNTIDIICICLLTICVCHCALQSKIHLLPNPEPIFVPLGALLPWLRTHAINDSKMYLPPVHLSYLKFPSCSCILIIYFSLFSIPWTYQALLNLKNFFPGFFFFPLKTQFQDALLPSSNFS